MHDESDIPSEPVRIPITSELDLHTFRPSEIASLLEDYFTECREAGIFTVRVIHGKGTGALRQSVHTLLDRMSIVKHWTWPLAAEQGSWGATLVTLA
jgi:DNA-nicking Smr family endonuclease